jgi:hypothetical protein
MSRNSARPAGIACHVIACHVIACHVMACRQSGITGHRRNRAIRTWQPQPAGSSPRPLAPPVGHYSGLASAQPTVPITDPGPNLTGNSQPDRRTFPGPGHQEHTAVPANRRFKFAAGLG